jgi:hypothetical protein
MQHIRRAIDAVNSRVEEAVEIDISSNVICIPCTEDKNDTIAFSPFAA